MITHGLREAHSYHLYTTLGGWGLQAKQYHKRLAELISRKRNEDYSYVINHIRVKVRFALLHNVLIAVRELGRRAKNAQPLDQSDPS